MKYNIKVKLQFIYYVLFSKYEKKLSVGKRLRYAFGGGFTVGQYYLYNLESKSKNEYLSEYDWFKSRLLNKPYDFLLNNKFLFNEYIKGQILTPKLYAVKLKGKLSVNETYSEDIEELIGLIEKKKKAIFKPIFAGKGNGVRAIDFDKYGKIRINDKRYDNVEVINFFSKEDDWIISEAVEQHEYSANIYGGAVNTIRIVVLNDKDAKTSKIAYAVHRFGTLKTGAVDNASKGGLVCKIDLENGKLTEARSIKNTCIYKTHPDTGAEIEGISIPNWDCIKDKILNVSERLFFLKLIAWDIVITENGPVVIEANSSSGVNILQLWEGQKNLELGKFLRQNGIIK